MSVENSESRSFEPKIRLGFSQANLCPTSTPDFLLSGFSESFELFVLRKVPIASCTQNIMTGIFGIQTFMGAERLYWLRSKGRANSQRKQSSYYPRQESVYREANLKIGMYPYLLQYRVPAPWATPIEKRPSQRAFHF